MRAAKRWVSDTALGKAAERADCGEEVSDVPRWAVLGGGSG